MNQESRDLLRHPCWMTAGRVGFVSFLDASDVILLLGTLFFANQLTPRLTSVGPLRFLLTIGFMYLAWVINFAVKKRLSPYPKLVEYWYNWWFNGDDYFLPERDPTPVPLVVTSDLKRGHAMRQVESRVKRNLKKERGERSRRVSQ